MGILTWLVVAGGGLALAAAGGGSASGSGGAKEAPEEKGFRYPNDCSTIEVLDEAKALAWARRRVAELPAKGWEMAFAVEALGPCASQAKDPNNLPKLMAQVTFIWRLTLYALAGAIDSDKMTRSAAEARVKQVLGQAQGWGIDPALLVPTEIPQ